MTKVPFGVFKAAESQKEKQNEQKSNFVHIRSFSLSIMEKQEQRWLSEEKNLHTAKLHAMKHVQLLQHETETLQLLL